MQFLELENVTRTYGDKVLFDKISLTINKSDKIALVAKNGTGKTTLLRIIGGEEGSDGDHAKIIISKEIKTAILKQEPSFEDNDTVWEAIFYSSNPAIQAIKNYEEALLNQDSKAMEKFMSQIDDLKAWDLEAKIKEILFRLKIENVDQKINTMSGGQKKRVALAKVLIEEPDFLILDEPTNHLDIEMIEWLENYLQQPNLTLFMVTHDRYFLESVCNEIVELEGGKIHMYRGNYSQYLEKKAARMQNEEVNADKAKKLFGRELEWMRRMPQARTTKAKSRIDDFYELKDKVSQHQDKTELSINIEAARQGSKILECHALIKNYGDKKIVNGFSYKFKKSERVGIIGANGTGKSTFLQLITQNIAPDGGKIVIGDTTVFGYYSQEGLDVSENKMVIDVIRDIAEYIPLAKGFKLTAESLLEKFLFPRSQQRVLVSQLSGGEKRRLYLLTILMKNPNFLILDEPTNDLDILTLNVLEEYLLDFPGCLIIVTHDRYFMDKLVDHLFVLEGGGEIQDFNGTYTEYRLNKKQELQSKREEAKIQNDSFKAEVSENKLSYEQRKEFSKLEKEIQKLEEQRSTLSEKLNNLTDDLNQILKISEEIAQINEKIVAKEEKWFELAEIMGE